MLEFEFNSVSVSVRMFGLCSVEYNMSSSREIFFGKLLILHCSIERALGPALFKTLFILEIV